MDPPPGGALPPPACALWRVVASRDLHSQCPPPPLPTYSFPALTPPRLLARFTRIVRGSLETVRLDHAPRSRPPLAPGSAERLGERAGDERDGASCSVEESAHRHEPVDHPAITDRVHAHARVP